MSTTATKRTRYGEWLQQELVRQSMGKRTLARKVDPVNVERERRNIIRYTLEGVVPGPEKRAAIEDALGVARGSSPAEEDEDEDPHPVRQAFEHLYDTLRPYLADAPLNTEAAASPDVEVATASE